MDRPLNGRIATVAVMGVIGLLLSAMVVPAISSEAVAQQTQPEADNTVTRIEVYENGSARWTIQIRTRLDTTDRVEEYQAFQSRFEENRSRFLDQFRTRMRAVVANAADVTNRDMSAAAFSASTSIQEVPRRWGVVTFEFTWTNFAVRTGDTLVVGDAFDGGFFLAANDTLVLTAPNGYAVANAAPSPNEREPASVSWVGREDFADGHPRVEFAPETVGSPPETSPTDAVTGPPAEGVDQTVWIVGGLLALVVAVLGIAVYRYRRGSAPGANRHRSDAGESGKAGVEVTVTDEERVRRLLEDRGGRVRQAAVADELGWSASKTSRIIGRMVDAGTVEKLQLGRENLLELIEEEE
ncbi:MAG: hypothetical protein R3324_07220 [Halobacteriales archaeon]|nr:hypothetical protein [Halobacteriales archaeon]